jgi:phage/plasmid-like protein (TIGR03299 family)
MTPTIDQLERQKLIAARINSGKDTYAGRLDAWHDLGNVSGTFRTGKEILAAAGANFPVVKQQLQFFGKPVDAWGTFRVDDTIPKGLENKAIRIELADGSAHYLSFLGDVGKDYQVIQTSDGTALLDRLVGQIDGAHYETAGVLDFGRVVWSQVNPNFAIRVGEDVTDILLTFLTSHDGSRAFDIYETGVRQVCKNTVRIGSLKRLAASLRVRHTKGAQSRVDNLKAEIEEIKAVAMSMQEKLTYLSRRKVTKESLTTVMNRLFPPTKNDDGVEISSPRRENTLAEILSLYESNDNNAFPEQRGSGYNLLNAITNYTDHSRSSKGNGRAESAVFGSGDRLKTNALDLILKEADNMPAMPERVVISSFADIGLNVN